MKFTETKLQGCFILEPNVIRDERGYFMESFNERTFQNALEQSVHFVQDNQSFSSQGVLRGFRRVRMRRVIVSGHWRSCRIDRVRPGGLRRFPGR